MSLFGSIARELKGADGLTWGQINELWAGLLGGGVQSKSGPAVGWLSALRCSAMLAGTRRITDAVATVPCKVKQGTVGTNKVRDATDHSLYNLLATAPNEWMDSLQFRETLIAHAVVARGGFAFINRVRGKIVELILLGAGHCQVKPQPDRSIKYLITAPDGTSALLDQSMIFYVRGLSWDGYHALEAVHLAREALGLSLAIEQTHAMLHAHGARPSGLVSVTKQLDEKELIRLAAWVRKHYGGLDNVSRVMILDNDAKFTPFDMKGVDAQHIELRKFEIEEVCRFLGIMPMVIGFPAEMAARAAVDSIMSMHLAHTVRPWHRRFEYAANRQLLTKEELAQGFYVKLIDGEFLRATARDRAEYNKAALGGGATPGWATPNDVRGWDDMDQHDGGDHIYAPLNSGPIGLDGVPILPAPRTPVPAIVPPVQE